jgi:hypothetical protein
LRSLTVCALELQAEISNKTSVKWASFCREVIYDAFILNEQKLGGFGGLKSKLMNQNSGAGSITKVIESPVNGCLECLNEEPAVL